MYLVSLRPLWSRCFDPGRTSPAERLCPKCGFDPSPGIRHQRTGGDRRLPGRRSHSHRPKRTGRESARTAHHAQAHRRLDLAAGADRLWRALDVAGHRCRPKPTDRENTPAAKPTSERGRSPAPGCDAEMRRHVFRSFSPPKAPEARNQFVLSPISTASRMARFYSLNPWTEHRSAEPRTHRQIGRPPARRQRDRDAVENQGRQAVRRGLPRGKRRVAARLGSLRALQRLSVGTLHRRHRDPTRANSACWPASAWPKNARTPETISLMLYAPRFGHPERNRIPVARIPGPPGIPRRTAAARTPPSSSPVPASASSAPACRT